MNATVHVHGRMRFDFGVLTEGEDDGVDEVDLLEKGLPLRVGILELLHGEDEVGDNKHKHNKVEGK